MNTKSYPASFKALDDQAGTFSAIVSVFGNVDLIGDRVMPGAFADSLKSWRDSGDPIPILWSHNWYDPNAHIGSVDPANVSENEKGLLIEKATLDLDNPMAAQVYRLLKERRVKEFSFSYDIVDEGRAKDGANDLRKLALIEAGPTLKGMNSDTELISVKADGLKAGRVLSAKNEGDLKQAADLITAVLAQVQQSSSDTPSGKAEEPDRANASREATGAEEPSGANAPKRSRFEMELELAVSELPSA